MNFYLTIWVAFWAGVVSFASPCCLPLYPTYITLMTRLSTKQLHSKQSKRGVRQQVMMHTLCFILGISIVFYMLGWSATYIGFIFIQYRDVIRQLCAIIIIVMGLISMGLFRPHVLMKERKWKLKQRKGYSGSFLLGIGFSAGWSPCIGPILGTIVSLSVTEPRFGMVMMTAYCVGFALPFFLLSFFISLTSWLISYSDLLMKIGGVMMIGIGSLLFTDQLQQISIWLQNKITTVS